MLIQEHRSKRGKTYWVATAETEPEKSYFINHDYDWKASKWGKGKGDKFFTYNASALDEVSDTFKEVIISIEDEKEDTVSAEEAKELSVQELRKAAADRAKSEGKPTTDLRTKWNRQQLTDYLTNGTWPEVNTAGPAVAMPTPGTAGGDAFGQMMAAMISPYLTMPQPDEDFLQELVTEAIQKATKRIEVKRWDGVVKDCGKQHKAFATLLKLASIGEDTMLVGPAGSGKTTCCHKVADALDRTFYCQSVGAQTTKSDLIGYVDAHGKYVETVLYKAYKNGGVYLLDEVDAGNANVLTILNALLANSGYFFPNGEYVKRHETFICFAAANTFGRGADRLYVGRNQLDAATLDRFAVVDFDYDEELEKELAGNDSWTAHIQKLRKAVYNLKERVIISPRASIKGANLLSAGFTRAEAEEMVVWKGIPADIRQKIVANA